MLLEALSGIFDRLAVFALYLLGGKGSAKEYKDIFKED